MGLLKLILISAHLNACFRPSGLGSPFFLWSRGFRTCGGCSDIKTWELSADISIWLQMLRRQNAMFKEGSWLSKESLLVPQIVQVPNPTCIAGR